MNVRGEILGPPYSTNTTALICKSTSEGKPSETDSVKCKISFKNPMVKSNFFLSV